MTKKLLILLSFVILASPASLVFAEFSCESELHYSWKKNGEENSEKVHWAALDSKGSSEEEAKKKLGERIARETEAAQNACAKEHENLSGCVSGKYSLMSSVLQRLSFSARKSLEEAIVADCQSKQGTCKDVEASEIKCKDLTPAAEEGKEEEGKKKGKKKK